MATASLEPHPVFAGNQDIIDAIIKGVDSCMGMCGLKYECVGFSSVPTPHNSMITGMIGVSGDVSGFMTVDMPESCAVQAVSSLLQEDVEKLSPQVYDGVGEIANIISGGLKSGLQKTQWAFSGVTVPSIIVGKSYNIAFATGLKYASCQFSLSDTDIFLLEERTFQVGVSLIKK
ncbi:MAG: chemotaxis protein CheX [Planctomycetia bacterium]